MTAIDPAARLAAPAKLPFWRTLAEAYALWAKHLPEIVGFSWLWLLVMAPVFAVLTYWQAPIFVAMMDAANAGLRDPDPAMTTLLQAATMLVMLPILSSLAVAWHRRLLRDERVRTRAYLRFDAAVAGYAFLLLVTGLLAAGPQLALQAIETPLSGMGETGYRILQTVGIVASVAGLYVAGRLFLVLPARAVGHDLGFAAAWRASRRNGWRLFFGYLLTVLPVGIAAGALSLSLAGLDTLALTVTWAAVSLLEVPGTLIAVGFLSLAYRALVEGGGAVQ
jgi:hypothetical protein